MRVPKHVRTCTHMYAYVLTCLPAKKCGSIPKPPEPYTFMASLTAWPKAAGPTPNFVVRNSGVHKMRRSLPMPDKGYVHEKLLEAQTRAACKRSSFGASLANLAEGAACKPHGQENWCSMETAFSVWTW